MQVPVPPGTKTGYSRASTRPTSATTTCSGSPRSRPQRPLSARSTGRPWCPKLCMLWGRLCNQQLVRLAKCTKQTHQCQKSSGSSGFYTTNGQTPLQCKWLWNDPRPSWQCAIDQDSWASFSWGADHCISRFWTKVCGGGVEWACPHTDPKFNRHPTGEASRNSYRTERQGTPCPKASSERCQLQTWQRLLLAMARPCCFGRDLGQQFGNSELSWVCQEDERGHR